MSRLIDRNNIPEAYVRGYGYRSDTFTTLSSIATLDSAARLLLRLPSTVVSWLDINDVYKADGYDWLEKVLVGANLHEGHSEGKHKIIVQDAHKKLGPWLLYAPPSSGHTTFYKADTTFPTHPSKFAIGVANPLKIRNWYITDSPTGIIEEFKEMGYTFIDSPMPREILRELSQLE